MEKSHDDRSEEVDRLGSNRTISVLTIYWIVNVFGEYSTGYFPCGMFEL